jgi:predicted ATPase
MLFIEGPIPAGFKSFPIVGLTRDTWDDFGYKTTFYATLYISQEEKITLGDTKIMKIESRGQTPLPAGPFKELDENYCSIGTALSYYERLMTLGEKIYQPILTALRDAAYSKKILAKFEDTSAFEDSLLRSSGAAFALREAPKLFNSSHPMKNDTALELHIKTNTGGSPFNIEFNFNDTDKLPSRINAVIGYNGTGKTQLLAKIAKIAVASDADRAIPEFTKSTGRFISDEIRFGAVIAVSYSAFDTFELPASNEASTVREKERGSVFGYAYCGLRKGQSHSASNSESLELKSIKQITDEFCTAISIAMESEKKKPVFLNALGVLMREPSFGRTGLTFQNIGENLDWKILFEESSTGHKLALNIIAQLVAQLETRSLVLIDEIETHLHPPLLAALLKSIHTILPSFDSYCILATHSPVILQEIPSKYVRILKRFENHTEINRPKIETFSENIGIITREAFNLDSTTSDYHDTLEKLAQASNIEEIEKLFDGKLSSLAKAYIASKRESK